MSLETGINAFVASKQLQIENRVIVNGDLISDQLILTQEDGTTVNAGFVVGADGADFGLAEELLSEVNLNDILAIGRYSQSEIADSTLALNYPVPAPGILNVVPDLIDNTMIFQTYSAYREGLFGNSVWTRVYFGGAWTPWVGVCGSDWQGIPDLVDTTTPQWIDYGGIFAPGKFRIWGNEVQYRGLIKYKTLVPDEYGSVWIADTPIEAPPLFRTIVVATCSPSIGMLSYDPPTPDTGSTTPSGGTTHYHDINHGHTSAMGVAGIQVDIDKTWPIDGPWTFGWITALLNTNSDYNQGWRNGNFLSLSGLSYRWK